MLVLKSVSSLNALAKAGTAKFPPFKIHTKLKKTYNFYDKIIIELKRGTK